MQLGNFNISGKLITIGLAIILGLFIFSSFVSFSNGEVDLRNTFTKHYTDRTAAFDKMWKTLSQKGQVAVRNDSSFQNIVKIQMNGQKDGEQVVMKWIQQSNPTATFTEVSKMYQDLSRTIESERTSFLERETTLSSIKMQHDNLLGKFPGSFYNMFMGRKPLEFKPITSDRTDEVIRTGKDNNVEVF